MVELAMLSVFLFILAIGGFVADYIFPHIKPLQRYIDSLPMMERMKSLMRIAWNYC